LTEALKAGVGSTSAKVAGRYALETRLARGGMGSVYSALDASTGQRVAFKRLTTSSRLTVALFEREYRILRSLRHPRIIEVYDYGVDDEGAYFAMELLPGSDLFALAPVPYVQACAYLRDVASSLALLHARRFLHRDVSPRNVRVTEDGRCKLIDFGALMSFGVPSHIVGTPPCTPPEALRGAPLDQRADLYGLGATAYWLLTRRFPYPATSFEGLSEAWKRPLVPPSQLADSIPPALDELVLSLLRHDPLARPQSADDVIDRLTAIAGLAPEAELQTAQSYLLGTALIGRERELEQVQQALRALLRGKGSALLFEGESGLGRTRLLGDAGVQGQLAGATVLQVDAERDRREYGVALALAAKLLDMAPADAKDAAGEHAAVIARLTPALRQRLDPTELAEIPQTPGEWRGRVQAALLAWLLRVSDGRALVLAVDNLERADDASVALLSALAAEAPGRRLLVLATLPPRETPGASGGIRFLRERATLLPLAPLTLEQSVQLARSTFGELPNIVRLGEWMHRVAGGVPSHCLELASDLINRGIVRYVGGAWHVPSEVALESLPSGLEEALVERIGRLAGPALALLEALSVHNGALALPLCQAVARAHGIADVFGCLDELLRQEVLTVSGDNYRFHQEALREIVLARMNTEKKRALHAVVGRAMLELADEEDRMARVEAGFHLLRGGQELAGAELLANTAMEFEIGTGSLQAAIPALEAARRVYIEHGRSLYELLPIVTRLATEGYYSDRRLSIEYGAEAFRMLREATGLTWSDSMRPYVGKHASVFTGLAMARLRFAATPPAQRMGDFTYVFVLLVNCVTTQAGVGTVCLDTEAVQLAANFMEPLTALGPGHVTTAIHQYCECLMQMTLECRSGLRSAWKALLARFSDPGQLKALPEYVRQLYVGGALFALGLAESWHDGEEALECARQLEALGLRIYDRAASQIRMVYHVGRGELELADMFRRRMEMDAVQTGSAWQVEVTLPLTLTVAYSTLGDNGRLRRSVEQIEQLARAIPSLVRTAKLGRGALLVLRGTPEDALAIYDEVLAHSAPCSFVGWGRGMGHWAEALNMLGRHAEAKRVCEGALAQLSEEDRWFVRMFLSLEIQLAVAEAGLGRPAEAARELDRLIAKHTVRAGPVTLGRLHAARATVALQLDDRAAFEAHLREVGRWYRPTKAPSLIASFEQLAKRGAALLPDGAQSLLPEEANAESQARTVARVQSAMSVCRDRTERAQHSLRLILDHAGANQGYLFTRVGEQLELTASEALEPPPEELTASLQELVVERDGEAKTAFGRPTLDLGRPRSSQPSLPESAVRYHTHLLWTGHGAERNLVGVAAISSNSMRPVSAAFLDAIAGVLAAKDSDSREA
jgi:hypothetical protein